MNLGNNDIKMINGKKAREASKKKLKNLSGTSQASEAVDYDHFYKIRSQNKDQKEEKSEDSLRGRAEIGFKQRIMMILMNLSMMMNQNILIIPSSSIAVTCH